ncbi:P-loop containing nucleoside triphosphate hydrolase protein [Nemania sp. FL0031]|nr:P-loop containing nucleoside triphosphate hydrolase protein [Nemania sp. FL0031]
MASSPNQVVIGVFGMTGAGKSTFINTVTGRNDARVGRGLTSETAICQAYNFKASSDLSFSLIDTPGFNDTFLDDDEIFMQVAEFMKTTYQSHIKLTAVLYLHPIHHERLERSSLCHLSMFRELCGPDYYKHVVLATTFWSKVQRHVGVKRQEELAQKDEFWGKLKRQGAEIVELPDNRQLCIELLLRLARTHSAAPLQVQVELVDKGLTIGQTKASQIIELNKQIAVEEAKFAEAFANISLQKDVELAAQRRQREHELNEHLRRLQGLSEGNRELEGIVALLINILKSENPMRLAVQQAREWRIEKELEEKRLRYRRQLNEFRITARRQDNVLSEAKRLGYVKMRIWPADLATSVIKPLGYS